MKLSLIDIRSGTTLYRHIVSILMGANHAPIVADLFLFGYEIHFIISLSGDKNAEIIETIFLRPDIWMTC